MELVRLDLLAGKRHSSSISFNKILYISIILFACVMLRVLTCLYHVLEFLFRLHYKQTFFFQYGKRITNTYQPILTNICIIINEIYNFPCGVVSPPSCASLGVGLGNARRLSPSTGEIKYPGWTKTNNKDWTMSKTYSADTTSGGTLDINSGNPPSLKAGPKDSGGSGNHCLIIIIRLLITTITVIIIIKKSKI